MMLLSDIVLVCSILVQVALSDPPDCRVKYDESCDGILVSGDLQSTAGMLKTLHDHLCGCVYVTGAIDIRVNLSWASLIADNAPPLTENDFSFFYHIREIYDYLYLNNIPQIDRISFPNLRIIRGENLVQSDTQYALAVIRSDINNLYMPNLTEITKGNVIFTQQDEWNPRPTQHPYHCNVLTINWADILPPGGTLTQDLDKCTDQFKPNCSSLGCDYCWCDDMSAEQCCQELTRECSYQCGEGGRCHGQVIGGNHIITCCDSVCAGGCDGGEAKHCRACTLLSILNSDTCEDNSPNSVHVRVKPRSLFPCREGMFEHHENNDCVEVCPIGMRSVPSETGGMKCEICEGYYCKGNSLQSLGDNCTLVTGDFDIVNSFYNPSYYKELLYKLESIRVIRGRLWISLFEGPQNFPFLSNLEVLGDDSEVVSCGSADIGDFKLFITHNLDLISIDFSSLRTIAGSVYLCFNPNLCFFGNLSNLSKCSMLYHPPKDYYYRRPMNECVASNLTCHSECVPIDGCFGTTDADCATCINYQLYNGRCVPTCKDYGTLGEYLYTNYSKKSCSPCHELCNGCTGEGPTHCHSCRTGAFSTINNGAGFECLKECDQNMYSINRHGNSAGTIECLPCSENCRDGCVGPLNIIDHSYGCLRCDTVILNRTGHQIMCTDELECPDYHYIDDDNSTFPLSMYAGQICAPCHENCHDCDGPELTDCISCKIGKICHIDITTSTAASLITSSSSTSTDIASLSSSISAATMANLIVDSGTSLDWLYFMIILPVAVIVLLVIAVVGGFYYYRKHKRNSINALPIGAPTNPTEMIQYGSGLGSGQDQKGIEDSFTLSFKIPPDVLISHGRITLFESIGQGEFGVVHRASLFHEDSTTQTTVAVKTIKGDYTQKELNDLLEESLLMRGINHSNVMGLIGICTDGEIPLIVLPYMEGGPLLKYLRNNKESLSIGSSNTAAKIGQVQLKLTEICLQIARGMEYLAKLNLIHRDLAARNCMLDNYFNVKVADFGLSKGLYYKAYFKQEKDESVKLPVKWLAIECMEYGMFTEKSDVWAYGVTCWEVFSCGKIPYGGVAPYNVLILLKSDQRMKKPENTACSDEIFQELMGNCWKASPEDRPCFSELVTYLDQLVSSITGRWEIANESNGITVPNDDHDEIWPTRSIQENETESI